MNKWFTPGIIVGIVLIGFVWLRFVHDPSVRRQAENLARADSIEVAQAVRDSVDAVFDSVRAAFQAELDSLRADSAQLAHDYERSRYASTRVITRVDTVLAELPRSVREIIAAAVDTLKREAEACHALLENCERRAEIMQAQLSRDTLAIEIARSSTRELATQIQDLLRQGPGPKLGPSGIVVYNFTTQSVDVGATWGIAKIFGMRVGVGVTFRVLASPEGGY